MKMFAPVTIMDSNGETLLEVREDGTTVIHGNVEVRGKITTVEIEEESESK